MAGTASAMLPPGPTSGRLAQVVRFHRDPLKTLQAAQAQFGDVFTVRMAGIGRAVVVLDPEEALRLADLDHHAAHAGEGRRHILPQLSPRSILGSDGDEHQRARSLVVPAFTAERMRDLAPAIGALAEEHVARWPRGRPFRLLPRMRALSDDVFVRLVVGVRDEARVRALAEAIQQLLWTPGNPPLAPPPGGVVGKAIAAEFERRLRRVIAPLAEELRERRQGARADAVPDGLAVPSVADRRDEPEAGDSVSGGPAPLRVAGAGPGERTVGDQGDLLDILLSGAPDEDDAHLIDQLIPILLAGQEPSACGLTWLLDRLGRDPQLARQVVEAAPGEPRREAIVRETWRLRPGVAAVMRPLPDGGEVAGHRLPPGTVTMLPLPALHHHPDAFADPEAFRPERFLDGTPPGAPYLPFGAGARRCLGEQLVRAHVDAAVPAILRAVRLRPLSRAPERMVVRGTVCAPQRQALVVAR